MKRGTKRLHIRFTCKDSRAYAFEKEKRPFVSLFEEGLEASFG